MMKGLNSPSPAGIEAWSCICAVAMPASSNHAATNIQRALVFLITISKLANVANPFLNVRINRMIRLSEVSRIKKGLSNVFGVIAADGVGKYRKQVIDTGLRRFHQLWIVQRGMDAARVDV